MKPQIIEGLVFLCVLVQIALNREKNYCIGHISLNWWPVRDKLNLTVLIRNDYVNKLLVAEYALFQKDDYFFIDIRVFLKQIEIEMKIQVNTSLL